MTPPRPADLLSLDMVVYDGFKALEAIGPMSVFDYANQHLRRRGLGGGYDVRVVAVRPGAIRSDQQMSLQAVKALSALSVPDTAIIVGARDIEDALAASPQIVDWVRGAATRMRRTAALCTGTFFLAAAGLLDGRAATTHWALAAQLQARHPRIRVDAERIFIEQDGLWTSAGVTAGIDLALAMVEQDFGRELALEVAGELVVYLKRPGGQSQFSVHLTSQQTVHHTIGELQAWLLANLDARVSVADMATRLAMSPRNFARTFRRETGTSPMAFLERARIEAARRALEDGDLPIKTIVQRTGFGSYGALRSAFLKRLGFTPSDYRAQRTPARPRRGATRLPD